MNYRKLILLLLLFIPFSVSAANDVPTESFNATVSDGGNNYNTSTIYYTHTSEDLSKLKHYYYTTRCFDADGNNKAESYIDEYNCKYCGTYRIRYYLSTKYILNYKGKSYSAVCIDKGIAANENVVCDPHDDPAISYVLTTYKEELNTKGNKRLAPEIALRALAYERGIYNAKEYIPANGMQSIYNSISGGPTSGPGEYLLEIKRENPGPNRAYAIDAERLTFSDTSGEVLDAARSIYQTALSQSAVDPSESLAYLGEKLNYTITKACDNGTCRYDINFDRKIKKSKIDVEVIGASLNRWDVYGNVLTIIVNYTELQCSFQIKIKFKDGAAVSEELNSSLFLCHSENNKGQSYVVQMDAPTPGTITINNNELCDCECPPYNEEEHIQMCCTDNEPSEVIEPFIKDLFCDYKPSSEILVHGFTNGCGTKYEISNSLTGIPSENDYCEVFCTERIHVTIPDASSAVVGMYFDLTPVNDESKGPLFKGKRTCRELIHYDKWVEAYVEQSNIALTNFNTSQQYLSYKKMYETALPLILSKERSGEASVGGTASYSGTTDVPSGCLDSEGSQRQGSVALSREITVSCDFTHDGYAYDSDYKSYIYPKAQSTLKYSDGKDSLEHNTYGGFEAVIGSPPTGDSRENGKPTGYYGVKWLNDDCGAPSTATGYGSVTCCEAECTPKEGEETCEKACESTPVSGDCNYESVSRENPDIAPTFNSLYSTATNTYTTSISAYNAAVNRLTKLEEYYKQCDEFYDDESLGAATKEKTEVDKNDPYIMYNIGPSVNFHYFQAHVENVSQMITPKETVVQFDVKCEHKLKKIDTEADLTVPSDETELGLEVPHYNSNNGNEKANVKSFNVKDVDYVGLGDVTGTVLDAIDADYIEYNQRYTHDAYYEDICTSNDLATGSYYVYPYGSISHEESKYYSTHDVSYYIEYSTLFADYETYWEFSSVGMDGRFDENFIEHETCSGNTNYDVPRLFCTLHVEPELTEISGCSQDAIIAFLDGFSYNWEEECCEGGDCRDRSTDQLTYTFKIVDSANLFPDGGYATNEHSTQYGYNWLEDSNGVKVLNEIQKRANYPSASDDVYSDNNISFEFNLSSQDLALVKEYNSIHSYNNFDMECKNIIGDGGKILRVENCKSNFITNYYVNGRILNDNDASIKLGQTKLDNVRAYGSHFHYYTA